MTVLQSPQITNYQLCLHLRKSLNFNRRCKQNILYMKNTKRSEAYKQIYAEYATYRNLFKNEALIVSEAHEEIYNLVTDMYAKVTGGHGTPGQLANFAFVLAQLRRLGLNTYAPMVHVKTFNQWKNAGYMVKKGEKAQIYTVVWKMYDKVKNAETGKEEKVQSEDMRPVIVPVFHMGQVKKLEDKEEIQALPAPQEQPQSVLAMF